MLFPTIITAVSVALGLAGSVAEPAAAPPRTVRTAPVFFITGHGWGHGIGMGQYGAFGYAQHGWKYDRIVLHYYTGTTLGKAPVARVKVLLARGAAQIRVSSKFPFRVFDADGKQYHLARGSHTVGPKLRLVVDDKKKPKPLKGPLLFRPGAAPLALNGRGYRGSFNVARVAGRLRVINDVPVDAYLWGVVPSEMPKDWDAEALKAQAVAARSYALNHLRGGVFDLFPDTRDQVYLGIAHEDPATTAAVNETSGKVVLYKGHVANTMFFSTSGGRTASASDYGAAPVPYLVTVRDPYDSISPYHAWGPLRISQRALARAFHARGQLLDVTTKSAESGRVLTVNATGSRGDSSVTGSSVRSALGLRSTWFRVGVLSLAAPATRIAAGGRVPLSGLARGVGQVTLQRLTDSGWTKVATLSPRGGEIVRSVRPSETTTYRIVAKGIPSRAITIRVAATLTLAAPGGTAFTGALRPVARGIPVQIQRQGPLRWQTVARARTTARGSFRVQFSITPGVYRARAVVRRHGAVFSRPLRIE